MFSKKINNIKLKNTLKFKSKKDLKIFKNIIKNSKKNYNIIFNLIQIHNKFYENQNNIFWGILLNIKRYNIYIQLKNVNNILEFSVKNSNILFRIQKILNIFRFIEIPFSINILKYFNKKYNLITLNLKKPLVFLKGKLIKNKYSYLKKI